MNNDHLIGIDIGTSAIKLVITEPSASNQLPKILHAVESPAHGFRHGYIVDQEKATESLALLITKAEREYKEKIIKARFSIGGVGLCSQYVRTSVDITKKNNEISEKNVEEVILKSEELFVNKYPNKKILHIIPVKYRVDGRDVLGTPIGMYGNTIEVKVIFITILEHHYDALISVIQKNNLGVIDVIASPIADAAAAADYKQKTQGCMVTNIGAETTSIATFENSIITSLDILAIGSNDITNDIALGLQIPLEEADEIKKGRKNDQPKRKVEEIIYARISDILELADRHLNKIKKNRLLPAGIIFTGGGAHLEHINEYAKEELKLPSESLTLFKTSKKTKRQLQVPNQFSIAYGLCVSKRGHQHFSSKALSIKNIKRSLDYWFNQIMP
ncbi:MAG: cell division protein FtsA [Crocinitomicaceae bacterium]|jgi:cell division protein FtsA